MPIQIDLLAAEPAALGESPLWDHRNARLWWVDALAGRLRSSDDEGRDPAEWRFDRPVGSIGLCDDGLILAQADNFCRFDPASGATRLVARPAMEPATRLNDGKADRDGRFLAASMRAGEDGGVGSLFRLDADGGCERIEHGMAIGNALCFSPAGDLMYFADSMEGLLRRYRYDRDTGAIGPCEVLADCREQGSGPDGATVDSEGRIWVALVLAQAIACYDAQGRHLRTIAMPVPYPSCPAFGGPALDTLYVTTIANSGHRLVADHPDAGRIVAVRGLDALGLAEGVYR
ncbi:SMP-30/gluconolactonase/LRE family protein [Sphingomonas colocasiae]|uniref:SMP-30/gluconolactonase/LRE family protein n=1 Tax=Sphingomonas colocasiae TaxID=1848973 RepID=A0ABS7PMY8_9SPHN|nr:SMP-30/gluconolactonase/LRE family protein [Sphingomonas colocasiae]MBY8822636.1 SMP-30/gluconolactonase/LRE family protein [Sphingomonas colocasiae]